MPPRAGIGAEWVTVAEGIVMHHANYMIGIGNKIKQLEYVKDVVEQRRLSRGKDK